MFKVNNKDNRTRSLGADWDVRNIKFSKIRFYVKSRLKKIQSRSAI